MAVLITGGSGFIAAELAARLAASRPIVVLTRSKLQADWPVVKGAFQSFEDLRKLDGCEIDSVVHLAAVTGGSGEEEALDVNVQGSRRLFRYLLDRGVRKVITASSIAAVGCLDRQFTPLALPIPDDHPCLAKDMYGVSKSFVEQLAGYFHRRYPDADLVSFRFGSVVPEDWPGRSIGPDTPLHVPFAELARVYVSDVVRALELALDAPHTPGARVFNLVGPDASCVVPTAEMLRAVLGERADRLDLSYYERPGNEHKPIYALERIREAFGFVPQRSMRKPQ